MSLQIKLSWSPSETPDLFVGRLTGEEEGKPAAEIAQIRANAEGEEIFDLGGINRVLCEVLWNRRKNGSTIPSRDDETSMSFTLIGGIVGPGAQPACVYRLRRVNPDRRDVQAREEHLGRGVSESRLAPGVPATILGRLRG